VPSCPKTLPNDEPDESRVAYQVPPPQSARLLNESMEPLEPASLHPARRPPDKTTQMIETSPDSQREPGSRKRDVGRDPVLLLWRSHRDKEEVRAAEPYRVAYRLALGLVEVAIAVPSDSQRRVLDRQLLDGAAHRLFPRAQTVN